MSGDEDLGQEVDNAGDRVQKVLATEKEQKVREEAVEEVDHPAEIEDGDAQGHQINIDVTDQVLVHQVHRQIQEFKKS